MAPRKYHCRWQGARQMATAEFQLTMGSIKGTEPMTIVGRKLCPHARAARPALYNAGATEGCPTWSSLQVLMPEMADASH
eukprot:CAMPEP_0179024336 /NCGR_PEP_ID=MMETSP0796-20121207/7401_1 /TAXON_ID=73915 /ORGANISM="Pyrodinium bahamense, Strain pbaha01" /LENGTH=79 /DNA_ID=CAMNT_0020720291 /DNA_START=162 /DNA_END=399 /DNA_ORIENTATION=-